MRFFFQIGIVLVLSNAIFDQQIFFCFQAIAKSEVGKKKQVALQGVGHHVLPRARFCEVLSRQQRQAAASDAGGREPRWRA